MRYKSLVFMVAGLLTGGVVIGAAIANPPQPFSAQMHKSHHSEGAMPMQPTQGMHQVDQHFIEMMIPHHQDAVAMADLAIARSQRPELKQLATAIKRDQTREIQTMQRWYKQWFGQEVPVAPAMGRMGGLGCKMMGQGQMAMGSGMMHPKMDLQALKDATDFDREFVRQMIPHHQMAVMMAGMLQRRSDRPEMKTLAAEIIQSQTAEIQQMQQWYQTW
jgi:uncharacterized protein (DUF305 family)